MPETTLADRLNKIIHDLGIPKSDFAKSVGISRNHIYQLTSGRHESCSKSLALFIEQKYGYPAEWVLTGEIPAGKLSTELAAKMMSLDEDKLRSVADFLERLERDGDK